MRDETPIVGLVVDFVNKDGARQSYRCIAISRRTHVATWRTNCADCGAPFNVTSQATRRAVRHRMDGLFATKCDEHRRQDRVKRKPAEQAEQPA